MSDEARIALLIDKGSEDGVKPGNYFTMWRQNDFGLGDTLLNPTRIDELVERATSEVDQIVRKYGEEAALELEISGLHGQCRLDACPASVGPRRRDPWP